MIDRKSAVSFVFSLLLLGCSTPQATRVPFLSAAPPPASELDPPLEQPDALAGRVCKLGASCLELDHRPFEPCLVSTRRCADKALEAIPAGAPAADAPRAIPIVGR
jgi:hypothetical protein